MGRNVPVATQHTHLRTLLAEAECDPLNGVDGGEEAQASRGGGMQGRERLTWET